jgi:hypothetical protein
MLLASLPQNQRDIIALAGVARGVPAAFVSMRLRGASNLRAVVRWSDS